MEAMKHYPNEVQDQVRAFAEQGYSTKQIAVRTGVPDRTIRNWRAEWPDLAPEQQAAITARSIELVGVSDRLQLRELEHLETNTEPGSIPLRDLMTLNAISGTHRDKLMAQPVTHQHIHFEGDPTITALAAQRLAELEAALKTQQSDD